MVDDIRIYQIRKGEEYYYSLTSMLKAGFSKLRVGDWLRTKRALWVLFEWESEHNVNFNWGEFAAIRNWTVRPGKKNFKLGVKDWIERTSAIGLVASPGRHGGTFAHWDIAVQFADWVNPHFRRELVEVVTQRANQRKIGL